MEGKHDMFTKVCDRKDIVDFVKEVEKHPCLYNKTLPEYANKVHNRRAWAIIAKKANTSIPDCRDKWRKIRISFMRSLKQQISDKPPMRPYYLTDELHFLYPFLNIKVKTNESPKQVPDEGNEKMQLENTSAEKQDNSDSDCSNYEDPMKQNAEMNRVSMNHNTMPMITNIRTEESMEPNKYSGIVNYNYIEGKPRKMFLLSMLPDVEALTEPEMRIFRREVISVIDKIIRSRNIRN
uniref:SFRICE_019919 n=1 Tax=Spodoptera frugiperda TaxID=7108 RepID=A0A2H1VFV7_SPOFR